MSWKAKFTACDNVVLHAYNRGVDRNSIFFRKGDYIYFLACMADALPALGLIVLAYTLMPNHYHIIVQQFQPYAVSDFLQKVCYRYVRYVNKVRSRVGHLFQGTFTPTKVQNGPGLVRLSHYVHTNAFQAKIVKEPDQWPYSSLNQYLGKIEPGFVTVDPILNLVGGKEGYKRFMRDYDPAQPASVENFIVRPPEALGFKRTPSGLLVAEERQ